jgi:rare lipoprotein A
VPQGIAQGIARRIVAAPPGAPPRQAYAHGCWPALLLAAAACLAGCSSIGDASSGDGPGASPPPNLEAVPDAVPRVEPIRAGGANRPYSVGGQRYVPLTEDVELRERGLASWYGRKFHGRATASGERYDMYAMTAAHPTMPLPGYARVRNIANGRVVVVRVNDRGPFVKGRVIDLSYTAALRLGLLRGAGIVEVERITNAEIARRDRL